MNNKFISRYEIDGITKSVAFDKSRFNKEEAEQFLNHQGIKNFFFCWEPYEPEQFNENTWLFRGDVGFDITTEKLLPYLRAGNDIILDSFGGDLWEGLKIYDAIKALDIEPSIGILGSCASAATLPLLATPNSWMSPNSRFLIHNPWCWEAGDHNQFKKASNTLEKETKKLANLYAAATGNEYEDMINLMNEERFMDSEETLKYNFISKINNKFNKKDDDMNNKEVNEKLSGLETMMNSIKSAVNKLSGITPKNIILQDTNGVELDFPDAETEDQIAVDMTVNVDGEAGVTGNYTMADGKEYVIESGVLTAINEPANNEEMEALKSENEDLKDEVSNLKNSLTAVEKERNELKASLKDVNTQIENVTNNFNTFKNEFSVEKAKVNTPPANTKGSDKKKFSYKK